MIHNTYTRLENAAARDRSAAWLALRAIDDALHAFGKLAQEQGRKVDCADPIERVAEAMAVCLVESDPALAEEIVLYGADCPFGDEP